MNDLTRFRDELPFGDDVLREIRGNVMKSIEAEPQRRSPWLGIFVRASLAAAALAVIVTRPVEVEFAPRFVRKAPPTICFPPPVTPSVATSEPPAPPVHRVSRRARPVPTIAPPSPVAEAAPVRIELQTSNPNIRILWITQPIDESPGETR